MLAPGAAPAPAYRDSDVSDPTELDTKSSLELKSDLKYVDHDHVNLIPAGSPSSTVLHLK